MTAATHIGYNFWLTFSNKGRVELTIKEPNLARDERKMLIQANLPKSLWSSPALRATINVTDDNHEPKFELDLTAAADALRTSLGVDVELRVVPPPEPDPEEVEQAEAEIDRLLNDGA
jgi:hypothetical protein